MKITIKELAPELLADYLRFFDTMVFSENPDWANCYCYESYFTGSAEDWTKDNNRTAVINLIEKGTMTGYLAFDKDKPVAWLNINKRNTFPSLERFRKITVDRSENICSVVCFVIHPDYRGQGMATQLLQKAISDYTSRPFDFMEAYPGKGDLSCEKHYKGPLSMYEKAGFQLFKEYDQLYVVRKSLQQTP
ncbi:GNAT family N-acetyltransferase [Saccharicrinis sp. FJH54]|uniref:GNAT family N-acetyltransferase n=1 Tax=Saccharicrinis sp. FJH54 TaxID=3344665 RepID=UPI0035D437CE